jgi:hypothetical protein
MSTAPFHLRCDLIAHPEYVSSQGFATNISLADQQQYSAPTEAVLINNRQPEFSWCVSSEVQQRAFQILVADEVNHLKNGQGNYWDSGKTEKTYPQATYAGRRPYSDKIYYWTVRIWDSENQVSDYATPQSFLTGKLSRKYVPAYYPLQKQFQFPEQVNSIGDGRHFVDFSKAAFGTLQLTLSSKSDRQEITIGLGEVLQSPERINREPGGGRRYRSFSLQLKKGTHTYQLQLTPDRKNTRKHAVKMPDYIGEVMPFRYVEIDGYPDELRKDQLQRSAVTYPFDEEASYFHSSDEVLNQVWDLCKYSIKATSFAGIYVDGDRERVPYESDAYINQLSHYGVDAEYSLARRTLEYLLHNATWPTEWILHGVLVAYADWMYTGSTRVIERYYRLLKNRTLVSLADNTGLISSQRSTRRTQRSVNYDRTSFKKKPIRDIVDWPQTGGMGLSENDSGETDGFEFCEINSVVNAFHYYTLRLMAEMSKAIGMESEQKFWRERQTKVYQSFQKHFFDAERQVYVDGVGSEHASQHTNMFPLAFGLVPPEHQASIVEFIKSRGMACSVYGAQYLLEGLYEAGEAGYALQLMNATTERSWYNMIVAGSTITMEAWGDRFKPNQDWNHAWGAVPANIIPRYLVGVRPLVAGFARALIQPQPAFLTEFRAKVPTIRGAFEIRYQRHDSSYSLELQIPGNVEVVLRLPYLSEQVQIFQNGQKVAAKSTNSFYEIASLHGGNYTFKVEAAK